MVDQPTSTASTQPTTGAVDQPTATLDNLALTQEINPSPASPAALSAVQAGIEPVIQLAGAQAVSQAATKYVRQADTQVAEAIIDQIFNQMTDTQMVGQPTAEPASQQVGPLAHRPDNLLNNQLQVQQTIEPNTGLTNKEESTQTSHSTGPAVPPPPPQSGNQPADQSLTQNSPAQAAKQSDTKPRVQSTDVSTSSVTGQAVGQLTDQPATPAMNQGANTSPR